MRLRNLVDQRFGRLVVRGRAANNKHNQPCWDVECDCGNELVVLGNSLVRGLTHPCGCFKKETLSELRLHDLTGRRFGCWTVLARAPNKGTDTAWRCRCACDKQTVRDVSAGHLVSGRSRSCGCAERRVTSHSHSGTRTYNVYIAAKMRCTNPNNTGFHNYGGRGIRFLFTSFEQFYAELGECPPGLTLGRIKNEDHYRPGNVQWETYQEQANKTRRNRRITAFGQTKNLVQWARLFWIEVDTLRERLGAGLSPEHALLDQGRTQTRCIASDAPFEERADWMRRFFEATATQKILAGYMREAELFQQHASIGMY